MNHQPFLDELALKDRYKFLEVSGNWDNHRPLLFLGLTVTAGDVIELGAGLGSTPYLKTYCYDHQRQFKSYDNNLEWALKTKATFIDNWDTSDIWQECGLCFIDHAPGEHRHIAIAKMAGKADVIVIHDTEILATGYMLDKVWPLFKYQLHLNHRGGGAGAAIVSNKIDVSVYAGLQLGQFRFDN